MNELIQALENENRTILTKNPKLAMEFDWSSDAYRLQYNEEMISKLKKLGIYNVTQQSELLPAFLERKDFDIITLKTAGTSVLKDWEEYLKAVNCG